MTITLAHSAIATTRPIIAPIEPASHPTNIELSHVLVQQSKLGVYKPNSKYVMHVVLTTNTEPSCFSQVVKQQEWRHAMGA